MITDLEAALYEATDSYAEWRRHMGVHERREHLERQERRFREEFQSRVNVIESELAELRNSCSHLVVDKHSDPSGGPSNRECRICGRDF